MKIKIEHGKKRYEAVPCGWRCSFAKPFVDATGNVDVCKDGCNLPMWYKMSNWGIMKDCNYTGLREIGGAK